MSCPSLCMLVRLMVAQVQECVFERVTLTTEDTHFTSQLHLAQEAARVSARDSGCVVTVTILWSSQCVCTCVLQVSDVYLLVLQTMAQPLMKDYVPFSWASMVQVKSEHFRAISHYYAAVALCDHTCKSHQSTDILPLLWVCGREDLWDHRVTHYRKGKTPKSMIGPLLINSQTSAMWMRQSTFTNSAVCFRIQPSSYPYQKRSYCIYSRYLEMTFMMFFSVRWGGRGWWGSWEGFPPVLRQRSRGATTQPGSTRPWKKKKAWWVHGIGLYLHQTYWHTDMPNVIGTDREILMLILRV